MRVPGPIDLQVNGFLGIDFSSPDLSEESFAKACRELLRQGTAAFTPTLITSPPDVYSHNLPLIARVMEQPEFRGRLLGLHLEGPFISPEPGAVGIHNPKWVLKPTIPFLDQLIEWAEEKVKLLTIAADAEGAEELTRYAVSRGITVSLGHQMASEDQLDRLARAGASALTHLGNAVPNLLHRHHNPIWAGLAADNLDAMIITDGHHLPPSVLKTIIRAKGVSRVSVVSDSSPIAGLPPGRYRLWDSDVVLEESGLLHDPQKGYLAGSSATMLKCMNYLASLNLLELDELLKLGFYNPLRLIKVDPESIKPDSSLNFDEGRFWVM